MVRADVQQGADPRAAVEGLELEAAQFQHNAGFRRDLFHLFDQGTADIPAHIVWKPAARIISQQRGGGGLAGSAGDRQNRGPAEMENSRISLQNCTPCSLAAFNSGKSLRMPGVRKTISASSRKALAK